MNDNEELRNKYEQLCIEYTAALSLVMVRINNILSLKKAADKEIICDPLMSRIKSFKSARDKAAQKTSKKEEDITIEDIIENVQDIAGARQVVLRRKDVKELADRIKNLPGVTIYKTKDYIECPKENGYKSLHLKVRVEISTEDGNKSIPVEIQLRTYCMHMWAQIEHLVAYKYCGEVTEKIIDFKKFLKTISKLLDKVEDYLDALDKN